MVELVKTQHLSLIHILPMTEQTGVKYYLDENRDYCVPKRSAEEIARSL